MPRAGTGGASSCSSCNTPEGGNNDTLLALHCLHQKLAVSQPYYAEEDVVISLATGRTPLLSPIHGHHHADELCMDGPTPEGVQEVLSPVQHEASLMPVRGIPQRTGADARAAKVSDKVLNLDAPISASDFLDAVKLFDAKQLSKSRRVAQDAVKLIRHGYALVWRDADYIAETLSSTPPLRTASIGSGAVNRLAATQPFEKGTTARVGRRAHSSAMRRSCSPPQCVGGSLYLLSVSPTPAYRPSPALIVQLDKCIQVLLVYANTSLHLQRSLISNEQALRLLCFVGCAARRIEQGESSSVSIACGMRDADDELKDLMNVWLSFSLTTPLIRVLRECYLTEFLLDVALPPAVCSTRYEGLQNMLCGRKEKLIADMMSNKTGLLAIMTTVTLRGVIGLLSLSVFSDPPLRARLLNRMVDCGLIERLRDEIEAAFPVLLQHAAVDPTASRQPSTSCTPPSPQVRVRKRDRTGLLTDDCAREALGPSPDMDQNDSPSPRRLPGMCSPTIDSPGSEGGRGFPYLSKCSPHSSQTLYDDDRIRPAAICAVEKLGFCVDILLLLTQPNLRHVPMGAEMPSGARAAASTAIRCTTWASHTDTLQSICVRLLWLASLSTNVLRRCAYHLREQAMECVCQFAAYSDEHYGIVVRALDDLFLREGTATIGWRLRTKRKGGGAGHCTTSTTGVPNSTISAGEFPATSIQLASSVALTTVDASGLLPLLVALLSSPTWAVAHTNSIRGWFAWLSEHLLPQVFETLSPTTVRRSSPGGGQKCRAPFVRKSAGKTKTCKGSQTRALALSRGLGRAEVNGLSPYFRFACRLVEETSWRDGAEPFLARVSLLSYYVIIMQARRPGLLFGQASACYAIVAPLMGVEWGDAPTQLLWDSPASTLEGCSQLSDDTEEMTDVGPFVPVRIGVSRWDLLKYSSSALSPKGRKTRDVVHPSSLDHCFSRLPTFYEAYSSTPSEAVINITPRRGRSSTLNGDAARDDENSPPSVTKSWRERSSFCP